VEIVNFSSSETVSAVSIPLIPKTPEKGYKTVIVAKTVRVELVDVENIKVGDLLGLMRFCVVKVDEVDWKNKLVKVSYF
jgi:hypothetical protein